MDGWVGVCGMGGKKIAWMGSQIELDNHQISGWSLGWYVVS